MAKIEKFEDIESWKLAREITKLIYTASSEGNFSKDFALVYQISPCFDFCSFKHC